MSQLFRSLTTKYKKSREQLIAAVGQTLAMVIQIAIILLLIKFVVGLEDIGRVLDHAKAMFGASTIGMAILAFVCTMIFWGPLQPLIFGSHDEFCKLRDKLMAGQASQNEVYGMVAIAVKGLAPAYIVGQVLRAVLAPWG